VSFPKYPRYIESEVSWLEAIPEHWRVQRLKYVCSMFSSNVDKKSVEGQPAVKLCNYTDVYYNEEINERLDFMPATATQEQIEKFTLKADDTLITKDSESPDDIAVPAFVPRTLPGVICGYHLAVIRPKSAMNGRFVSRLFQSSYVKAKCHVGANGLTRYGLSQSALNDLDLPVPPLLEQLQISSFLDQETSKIDALITEQQRLIELLKEKRQAVISHAVIKGLNPDVRMKPSGVEWLGEVPEHWEVLKGGLLGTLFGSEPIPEEAISEEGEIAFVKVSSMSASGFEIDSWNWFVDSKYARKYEPRSDFLVFPKRGAAIFLNKVNIVTRPSVLDPNLMGWKINSRAIPKFIAYALRSRRLEEIADVSTVPQINNKHIAPQKFGVPPLAEQVEIVRYLDQRLLQMDSLVEDVELGIGLLQERRTALISAAVTGKIDVRNFASTQKDAA